MREFFKNFISLDEAKVSALILGFLFSLGWAIYKFQTVGDISDNWLTLLQWLIASIGGVNIADKFIKKSGDF